MVLGQCYSVAAINLHRLHPSEGNCCSGLRGIVVAAAAAVAAAAEVHQSKVTLLVLWLKTIWADAALGRALFLLIKRTEGDPR